jgi:hypothetical protein
MKTIFYWLVESDLSEWQIAFIFAASMLVILYIFKLLFQRFFLLFIIFFQDYGILKKEQIKMP